MRFDWRIIVINSDNLIAATLVTYKVALLAMIGAAVLGLILALMKTSPVALLSWGARIYVEFFRTIPLYVFLLWSYYGLRIVTGIDLGAMTTAVLTLAISTAAYMAEIYRSGFAAIPRTQLDAGKALGLSAAQTMRFIIMPQMGRVIFPMAINQFVGIIKGAALIGIIGVVDLMYFVRHETALTFKPFEFYSIAGVIFICTTLLIASLAHYIETLYRWELT